MFSVPVVMNKKVQKSMMAKVTCSQRAASPSRSRKQYFVGAVSALALNVALVVPVGLVSSAIMAHSAQAAVVSQIDVRGNRGIDAQTVRENLGISRGDNISGAHIDEATKRLFGMGLFSDVSIRQQGNVLIVQLTEYEVVNQVIFHGNKKIKDPDLERVLSLKSREGFDQTIRDAYAYIGRNDVQVTSNIVDLGQGRVNVVFEIKEGKRTKIGSIRFEGNKAFGNRRLRDVIATKRSTMLSWLTKGDVYSEDRLAADEEALRLFYHNRGFADFQIVSSSAVLDEANNKYDITFVVDEGTRYRLGDIEVESLVPGVDSETMRSILKTKRGEVYSARRVEDTISALNDKVADYGYAFAKVEPIPNRDFASNTISLTYAIDQGPRAYVERIEIRGNNKTRDYVVRREFDFGEGDAFNQTMVQRAKRRLERLNFFQTVNISTAPGSQPDQVVLIVDLAEKSTGEFAVGAGYTTGGTSPGASVEASITERNFLGKGQYIRLGAGAGQDDARNYALSFTEPYFLGQRLAAGFDLFQQHYRMNDDYDVEQVGGSIRFGIPITEALTASLAYNYVEEKYDLNKGRYPGYTIKGTGGNPDISVSADQHLGEYYSGAIIEASTHSPWRRSSISYGLTYNTIDDEKNPHDGWFVRVSQEYAGIGGNADYLKTSGKAMLYKTLSEQLDLVGLASVGGGYIHEFGDNGTRIFDMFKSSTDIIRGFKFNGIGPMQRASNDRQYFLGGTTYMHGTAELQFPMPVVPESLGMRAAFFADAATLYGNNYKVDTIKNSWEQPVLNTNSAWRTSAGLSVMWASPFGPLRFDYAWPLSKEEGDRTQNFNFGMSTKF